MPRPMPARPAATSAARPTCRSRRPGIGSRRRSRARCTPSSPSSRTARCGSSPARPVAAAETIAPVAAMLGRGEADVVAEPGLIEIDYGAWDGLTPDECLARDPELRRAWLADPYATRCPGGESGADVAARAFPILDRITAWLAADRARCAVVVAHNHVNRVTLARIMGWPMADYRRRVTQDPAGYSIVTYGDETPVVRRVNAPAAPRAPRADRPAPRIIGAPPSTFGGQPARTHVDRAQPAAAAGHAGQGDAEADRGELHPADELDGAAGGDQPGAGREPGARDARDERVPDLRLTGDRQLLHRVHAAQGVDERRDGRCRRRAAVRRRSAPPRRGGRVRPIARAEAEFTLDEHLTWNLHAILPATCTMSPTT